MMELDQYKILEKIGEGAYGVVYKALDTKNNAIVAVKEIRVPKYDGIRASNLREVVILKTLQHDNVVRVLDVVYTHKGLYLVLEYLDVNLEKHMSSCLRYSDDPHLIKVFLYQLLRGIAYCHSHEVMHRDLKPENLLIDLKTKTLKLADFGFARFIRYKPLSLEVMTVAYTPPEILLGSKEYCFSADMWCIGCIFAEMVNRKTLFGGDSKIRQSVKGNSQIRQLFHIFKTMGTPKEDTWPGITCLPNFMPTFPEFVAKDLAVVVPDLDKVGLDLLRKMLSVHPSSRITAKLALEHEFFKGISFP
uniref:cell division control protein 2 homolog n=1 Tax=Erigeron canadensis TaxID=72917 RepID=UPI001CB8E57D|nr:cell division control protein 2 homolog [Erigeron canadensis]